MVVSPTMRSLRPSALAIGVITLAPAMTGCPDGVRAEGGTITGARGPGIEGTIDLSGEGTLDWKHWGHDSTQGVNRKNVASPQIGDFTLVGTDFKVIAVEYHEQQFAWTDGTPTPATADGGEGIAIDTANPSGDGFQLRLAAEARPRVLRLYAGNWCVRARLEATLSDGSAEPWLNDTWDVTNPVSERATYILTYSAASSGEELTVDLVVDDNHCTSADLGEVWLQAATLQDG